MAKFLVHHRIYSSGETERVTFPAGLNHDEINDVQYLHRAVPIENADMIICHLSSQLFLTLRSLHSTSTRCQAAWWRSYRGAPSLSQHPYASPYVCSTYAVAPDRRLRWQTDLNEMNARGAGLGSTTFCLVQHLLGSSCDARQRQNAASRRAICASRQYCDSPPFTLSLPAVCAAVLAVLDAWIL